MKQQIELSAILKEIDKETSHDENISMEELIKDLILSSANEGVTPLNQNIRVDKIISIVSAREIE